MAMPDDELSLFCQVIRRRPNLVLRGFCAIRSNTAWTEISPFTPNDRELPTPARCTPGLISSVPRQRNGVSSYGGTVLHGAYVV